MIAINRVPPTPCSVEHIKMLEREIGVDLPRDYAQFLLRTNGGYCKAGDDDGRSVFDYEIPTTRRVESAPIAVMYSVGLSVTKGTVFHNILQARDDMSRGDPPIPKELIPIGHADNVWVITLGLSGRFRGGVYLNLSRHDVDWGDILVARSFSGFESAVTQREWD